MYYAGLRYLPELIRVPFYKTTFSEMADIGEADMRAITFEILKIIMILTLFRHLVIFCPIWNTASYVLLL
jgi:hypothetical protein